MHAAVANGDALIKLLGDLEDRFNGYVFTLAPILPWNRRG
jgi:hypothetical protein